MDKSSLIDAYLKGELSAEQESHFKELSILDSEFKNDFEETKSVYNLLMQAKAIELKEGLVDIGKRYKDSKKSSSKNKTLAIAGIILFMLSLILLLAFFSKKQQETKQLYAENFEVYPMEIATRGDVLSDLMKETQSLYQEGKYQEAIPQLRLIIETQEYDGKWYLFLASAYFKTGQKELSIEALNQIINNKDLLYSDEAQKYLDHITRSKTKQ